MGEVEWNICSQPEWAISIHVEPRKKHWMRQRQHSATTPCGLWLLQCLRKRREKICAFWFCCPYKKTQSWMMSLGHCRINVRFWGLLFSQTLLRSVDFLFLETEHWCDFENLQTPTFLVSLENLQDYGYLSKSLFVNVTSYNVYGTLWLFYTMMQMLGAVVFSRHWRCSLKQSHNIGIKTVLSKGPHFVYHNL